ncbi:protein kinase domain-containing protein [Mycobacterium sp.]|uniref:protein kinase domain-containing protein n=1 Tax=Mycobacterium sp. TaxID=1785 RepID=UPI003D6C2869
MARQRSPRRWGDRWEEVKLLGQGGQGSAYSVRDLRENSTGWVLKALHNPNRVGHKRRSRFEREIVALSTLNSGHIPPVIDRSPVGTTPLYFVTPFVGRNLTRVRGVVEPQALLERFRGVVVAVYDAHARAIVHRDIKPNNITVDDRGRPFLVDFGICAYDDSDLGLTGATEALGNRSFAAPECEPGNPDSVREPSDVYSLGKVLYWMTSGNRLMYREDFDLDTLTIGDSFVQQYVSVLIDQAVRENPAARCSVTELLGRVDWALAKVGEHAAIRAAGLTVLADGFGPKNECYRGGSRSATTPPRGNPPADHDVAESFFVHEAVRLQRIDIGVNLRHGSGRVEVLLIEGDLERPSGNVIERWDVEVTTPNTLQVLELSSASHPRLGPSEVYWVVLSASEDDSEIAWISAALELMPCQSRFAERNVPNDWELGLSITGPGHSLRVLARPEQQLSPTRPERESSPTRRPRRSRRARRAEKDREDTPS